MTNASRYCHRELFNRKSADYTHAARKQSFHARTTPPPLQQLGISVDRKKHSGQLGILGDPAKRPPGTPTVSLGIPGPTREGVSQPNWQSAIVRAVTGRPQAIHHGTPWRAVKQSRCSRLPPAPSWSRIRRRGSAYPVTLPIKRFR